VASSEAENLEIYLMNKDGSNATRITYSTGTDRYVRWSPDGRCLIYTSSRPGATAERLTVIDLQQQDLTSLDFNRARLEDEIDAHTSSIGLFSLLPESIIRKTYPDMFFGTERSPDWKF
jgi:tricorn protease-like protein